MQILPMEVTNVVITPNQALLTAPLNVRITVNSNATFTDVKVNSTFYIDSAYNNIPITVTKDLSLSNIPLGTSTITFSAPGIDVSGIPAETQMNMGIYSIIISSLNAATGETDEIIALHSVTQVAKKVTGGELYRTMYSPI